MNIPQNVLKELGVEKLVPVESKEIDMFDKMPLPMKTVSRLAWFDLNAMRNRFEMVKDIYLNVDSNKCTEEEIYSMEAYDSASIRNGQFLVDNFDRVRVWSGNEYTSAFVVYFAYSCRKHKLDVKLNASSDELVEMVKDNFAGSTLHSIVKENETMANFFKNEGYDALPTVVSWLKDNGWMELIIAHIFNNCDFIPLVIIDDISNIGFGDKSYSYGDIMHHGNVMQDISDFLGTADVKPNRYKFYYVKTSPRFGWYLKRDDSMEALKGVADIAVPVESVQWKDIKKNFAIRCGLNEYFAEVDYLPMDDVYYFVNVNETTNVLWLKRDKEKSPKGSAGKTKYNNKKS